MGPLVLAPDGMPETTPSCPPSRTPQTTHYVERLGSLPHVVPGGTARTHVQCLGPLPLVQLNALGHSLVSTWGMPRFTPSCTPGGCLGPLPPVHLVGYSLVSTWWTTPSSASCPPGGMPRTTPSCPLGGILPCVHLVGCLGPLPLSTSW